MNRRTCSDCRYEKEDASSEVCTNCHGIIKGEPSNWKNKSCLVCVNFGKGVHVKPCKDCIYNKYKPSFELDKKENKEMKEIKTCNNCRYTSLSIALEPCRSCIDIMGGERRNWNAPVEEIKTCSTCKHASDGLDDDICEQCIVSDRGGTVFYWEARNKTESKQEEHDETRSCDTCKYGVVSANIEPCMSCINAGGYSKWEAPLDETEGNNSDTKFIECDVCKYRYKDMDAEPCNTCVNMGRGDNCKGEEVSCFNCAYASTSMNEKPCKNCSKNSRNAQTISNLYFKPTNSKCFNCKHLYKNVWESPCNKCCEVSMGEDCKWEGVNCSDCKHYEVLVGEEPCKNCVNNPCNWYRKDKSSFKLCFEPKETQVNNSEPELSVEDEELLEEIASHDSKQGDFLDIEKRTEEAIDNLDGFVPRLGTTEDTYTPPYRGYTRECCQCMYYNDLNNYGVCPLHQYCWKDNKHTLFIDNDPQRRKQKAEQEEHFDEHYHDKVQPLEIMQEIMTPEEFRGFLFGNIIKYSCRCGKKDEPQKEFAKLRRYREWYNKAILGEHIDPRV